MKISRIELRNVKSFDGTVFCDFSGTTSMFAFSGANGAGKSTFLKMAWLVQKAHYATHRNDLPIIQEVESEARRFLTSPDSYAAISLLETEAGEGTDLHEYKTRIVLKLSKEGELRLEYSDEPLALSLWPASSPRNVVLFVDASKGFSEETLQFDEISILGNEKRALTLEAIYHPERLFTGIYRQMVKDYVHSRLIPSTPDRLLYYHVASKLFTRLIPKVELKNFSGNFKPGEFVLLGKVNRAKYTPLYDVREFSSGEKALLSTLVFLCISKSVSALIIDEPENHFHESLLLEFMSLLHKLCEKNGILNWVSENPDGGKQLNLDWVASEYDGHRLSQVLVSTHSKSLIYKFFTIGSNFLIRNQIHAVDYESIESKLREIGLSTTYSKVLFVEGDGDHEALEGLLAAQNVKIRALSGCSAVIETFKRLVTVREFLKESIFVFLVDSDNKPDAFFDELRALAPDFFDKCFVKLDVHEFENLYLDPALFQHVMRRFAEVLGTSDKVESIEQITSEMELIALQSLPQVYKKELSLAFSQAIERHFAQMIWGNKKFDWSGATEIQSQLSEIISSGSSALYASLEQISQNVFSEYKSIEVETLLSRCDGKQVFSKSAARFGSKIGVDAATFKKAIYTAALTLQNSKVTATATDIVERFQAAV